MYKHQQTIPLVYLKWTTTHDNTMDTDTTGDQTNGHSSSDEGEQNLDLMLCVMDEQDKLKIY